MSEKMSQDPKLLGWGLLIMIPIVLFGIWGCTKSMEGVVNCKECPCPVVSEPIPELAPDQKKIKDWYKRRNEG